MGLEHCVRNYLTLCHYSRLSISRPNKGTSRVWDKGWGREGTISGIGEARARRTLSRKGNICAREKEKIKEGKTKVLHLSLANIHKLISLT